MPPPFSVRAQDIPGTDLGEWDHSGNIRIPGNLVVGGTITGTVALSGNQTVTGLTVTGNETVGGTLGVTGTTTAASINSGAHAVTGTLSSTGATDLATGGGATTVGGNLTVPGVLKGAGAFICTSGAQPTSVQAGQIIFETDTGLFARWDGSVWRYFASDGTVSTIYRASAASGQAISVSTDTIVAFGTDNKTTPLVTKGTSGSGNKFTINKAGMWMITATVRWPSATSGQIYTALQLNAGSIIGDGGPAASNPVTHSLSLVQDLAVNDTIQLDVFQSSAGSMTLDTTASGVHINLAWIHG